MAFTAALCGIAQGLFESRAFAQQAWQPTRVTSNDPPQRTPLARQATHSANVNGLRTQDHAPKPALSSTVQVGSGVVLRWQKTAPRSSSAVSTATANTRAEASEANSNQLVSYVANSYQAETDSSDFDNPLRRSNENATDSQVRPAAYQQEWAGSAGNPPPKWRSVNTRQSQEQESSTKPLPDFPGLNQANPESAIEVPSEPQPSLPLDGQQLQVPSLDLNASPVDPLDQAESAPTPPLVIPEKSLPSFPPQIKEDLSPADRFKDRGDQSNPLGSNGGAKAGENYSLDEALRRAGEAATPSCISQREMLRGKPLSSISLDVSPKLSKGFSSLKNESDDTDARKEFEKSSMLRDWTDYKGNLLASGRLVDLRLGNIVLEVGGSERLIPLSSLSDVDMSYIADLWNLPFRCGTGFEPLQGRNFVASTVQWKASGACHNPLYFEQVQLERYGHEAGPILQPLISSAHFFVSIPLLPYKMGINPPNECQYSLGYFRPGNCAPYMIQPFPWSLRGGLAEAGAIVSGGAIIP